MKKLTYTLLFLSLTSALWSQQASQIDQAASMNRIEQIRRKEQTLISSDEQQDSNQKQAQEIVPGEAADVGPQFIVRSKPPRKKYLEASADTQFYYTSNMFLTEEPNGNEAIDTTVLVSTAQFALAPDPYDFFGHPFYPRLGFRHQWYNYAVPDSTDPTSAGVSLNNFDFDAQTVFTDMRWNVAQTWNFSCGFDWQRLLTHEPPTPDYQEFFKSYTPNWGIEKQFIFGDDKLISISYRGSYYFTEEKNVADPDRNDRIENSLTFSYMHQIIPNLIVQPYGRVLMSNYTRYKSPVVGGGIRDDLLYSTGLSVVYAINDYLIARTFINFDHRESNDITLADYSKFDTGLGLSLSYRF